MPPPDRTPAPTALRETIARDLRPARPLRRPSVRALALVPIAAGIVAGVPILYAFRPDWYFLGFLRGWGFSIAQAAAGLAIVALAMRESVPGRSLSNAAVAATCIGGLALPLLLVAITSSTFNVGPDPGRGFVEGAMCFRTSALAAVPALAVAAVLAARALPLRPAVAGALYGLGAGLMADAGLRLFCDYSVPIHVLFAHDGAVAASLCAGAIVAMVMSTPRS